MSEHPATTFTCVHCGKPLLLRLRLPHGTETVSEIEAIRRRAASTAYTPTDVEQRIAADRNALLAELDALTAQHAALLEQLTTFLAAEQLSETASGEGQASETDWGRLNALRALCGLPAKPW